MDRNLAIQYQGKTEAPPGAFPPIQGFISWFQAWSEPVRFKPGLRAHLQTFATPQTPPQPNPRFLLEGWYQPLSEPVRVKPGVRTGDQQFFFFEPEPPEFLEIPWFAPLSEPVRLPKGLKAPYQQFLAYHPRVLPPVNVTMTMAVTEVNNDVFLGTIIVYSSVTPAASGHGANVSVVEVPDGGTAPVSIQED